MKSLYDMVDVNVYQENIFHTKMLLLKRVSILSTTCFTPNRKISRETERGITAALWKEMREILLRPQYFGGLIHH